MLRHLFLTIVLIVVLNPGLLCLAKDEEGRIKEDLSLVVFGLYTRETGPGNWLAKSGDHPEEISHDLSNLEETHFDGARKTFVLMHGYTADEEYGEEFTRSELIGLYVEELIL